MTDHEILAYPKIEAYRTGKDIPAFPYRCPSCGARAILERTQEGAQDECVYACGGKYTVELPKPLIFVGICPEAERVADNLALHRKEPLDDDAIGEPETREEDIEQQRLRREADRRRDAEDNEARLAHQKAKKPKKPKKGK